MKKETKIGLVLSGAAAIATASYLYYRHYQKELPNRLLEEVKQELSVLGKITSSWIDCTLKTKTIDNQIVRGFEGGITITRQQRPQTYTFFIDKKTHTLTELTSLD